MEGPESIAGEQAGNERDPGHQRRHIHIAKGGMLAHGHEVELIAKVAVIIREDDVHQEGDAGDNQHGGSELKTAIIAGNAGAQG